MGLRCWLQLPAARHHEDRVELVTAAMAAAHKYIPQYSLEGPRNLYETESVYKLPLISSLVDILGHFTVLAWGVPWEIMSRRSEGTYVLRIVIHHTTGDLTSSMGFTYAYGCRFANKLFLSMAQKTWLH